ncbi:MAG: TonB-dependent receptor plug domain-containing protein [Candidatus Latescibacteria bacterium]|nr:TonB-dependent receptor plug domain-containing protein [bacterium]MBD3424276.1 TonB-dependent receptor plug domain-containing protein [Candidatus Latescibacterota bacterium]
MTLNSTLEIKTLALILLIPLLEIMLSASPRADNQAMAKSGRDSLVCYEIEEIVVTAKRISVPVETLPLSVSLITASDIELSTANSSTGIAGDLPGVFIQKTGGFGRNDVNIRGLGSRGRKSLVLIDGKPENMGLFGCTVTHSFLMHDVQRVEVIRGPSSTMYGSGAMGGVLNIIPRRTSSGLELDMKTAGGSNQTAVTSARAGFSSGRFFGSASIDYRESDGHTGNSSYRGNDIIARGGIYLGEDSEITASGKIFDGFKQEPAIISSPYPSETWNDYRRGSADIHFRKEGSSLSYSARYYRNFGEHRFSDGWHSRDATDGLLLHAAGRFLPWLELSGGADYRYQQGELPYQPGSSWSKYDYGLYTGLELSPWKTMYLSGSVRYNQDEVSGSQVSPTAGVTVRTWKGGSIRALVSNGFRSPQINELYMFPPSNRELEAETVWNYELGIRQDIGSRLKADLTVFRIDGDNFIETVPAPSPPPMYIFDNTGELTFNGMEFSLSGSWHRSLLGRVSVSLLDPGDYTRGRPGRKFDLSLRWNTEISTVKISGQRVDDYFAADNRENPISSYNIFDLYADLEIGEGLTAFASLENIFNEDYAVFTDLPGGSAGLYGMPGREFMAGLKYSLDRD